MSRRLSSRQFYLLKTVLFVASLLPAGMAAHVIFSNPPADPVAYLTDRSGETALQFLIITLTMTPLRHITRWASPIKLRGMFGLFAFFYALCHFAVYLFLDLQMDFSLLWDDVIKRVYITVGFAAFVLLIPLAITSNAFSIRRLGAKWLKLHRAVYAIGVLAAVHYLWGERGEELGEPIAYLLTIIFLLSLRLPPVRDMIKRKSQTGGQQL